MADGAEIPELPPEVTRLPQPDRAEPPPARDFLVVGLGASAGGLQALEAFFEKLPVDPGMALVVVTHQHPGHASILPELIQKRTPVPVEVVVDGVRLQPGRIYLPPPGKYLALNQGRLRLSDPNDGRPRLPIDFFFRTLSAEWGHLAAGIVLSGTGSDGAEGIRSIKSEAGMTMAQDQSATHAGMPHSATETGMVDFVLPPDAMPAQLLELARRLRTPLGALEQAEPLLQKVFLLLRQRTGHDFSLYKRRTVARRIERRIILHQLADLREYVRYLSEVPDELDSLFQELLIGVTCFFREPEAFQALVDVALPALIRSRPDGTLRAWVPACSTGEEAYSLAIALREAIDRAERRITVQVFATDVNPSAVEQARLGVYPEGIAIDVDAARLSRWFVKEDGAYKVVKAIRELVIFAPQDVLKDPPFTKLDLVSCRNLLIYMEPELQRRLFPLFHYALNPGGLLFLGSSESVTQAEELFTPLDKRWKIHARRPGVTSRVIPELPFRSPIASVADDESRGARRDAAQAIPNAADRLILELYAPPSLLVTARGEILHVRGRTGPYLEPAEGGPTLNAMSMAREGLGPDLAVALRRAQTDGRPVHRPGLRVKTNGSWTRVDLIVRPAPTPDLRGLFLVSFESARVGADGPPPAPAAPAGPGSALELELRRTRENLQATVEELEAANEELKSTNEELQSTNEELQSTNEELETSKEEMQSLNEELLTVNSELQEKVLELSRTSDDMTNLLNSTDIATLFLDPRLNIKRFTPQIQRIIKVIPRDVGRPLEDLASKLDYPGLLADARAVLKSMVPKQLEVRGTDGAWYLARILPYRTGDDRLDGLVLTFVDITPRRQGSGLVSAILEDADLPALVFDQDLRVVSGNAALYRLFRHSRAEVDGRPAERLAFGPWGGQELRGLLESAAEGSPVEREGMLEQPEGPSRPIRFEARRLELPRGLPGRVVATFEPGDPTTT